MCTGEELSEDELNQIIMVQYPEEDLPDGVMARSPPPSTPVTFSLGAPSSEDISPNNRKVRFRYYYFHIQPSLALIIFV